MQVPAVLLLAMSSCERMRSRRMRGRAKPGGRAPQRSKCRTGALNVAKLRELILRARSSIGGGAFCGGERQRSRYSPGLSFELADPWSLPTKRRLKSSGLALLRLGPLWLPQVHRGDHGLPQTMTICETCRTQLATSTPPVPSGNPSGHSLVTRPGTGRTLRGAANQIAAADTTQHAMATTKASL